MTGAQNAINKISSQMEANNDSVSVVFYLNYEWPA